MIAVFARRDPNAPSPTLDEGSPVNRIEAASQMPSGGGAWQPATPISPPGAGTAALAVAGEGATAAWNTEDGFETSDFTP